MKMKDLDTKKSRLDEAIEEMWMDEESLNEFDVVAVGLLALHRTRSTSSESLQSMMKTMSEMFLGGTGR